MTGPTLHKNGKLAYLLDHGMRGKLRDPNKHPMPCGHFGVVVLCTCKLRDRQCQTCKRVWVQLGEVFYEVLDPHADALKGLAR